MLFASEDNAEDSGLEKLLFFRGDFKNLIEFSQNIGISEAVITGTTLVGQ
jgi:hypothetical protein